MADAHSGSADGRSFVLITLVSQEFVFLKWFRVN